jgi:peptidoglycan DL-endopeptidase CwlO
VTLLTARPPRPRLHPGQRSPLRVLIGTTAVTVGSLLFAFSVIAPAAAEPTPAELERQIDEVWNKLEPTIEQYNRVRTELATNKAKAAKLAEQIRPLQLQVDMARSKISELSARYYKSGKASAVNALLTSGSPTTFADQLSMLEMIARNQQAAIHDVVVLKERYDAQKKPLDDLVAQLSAQEADLAAKTQQINDEIKRLNEIRLRAYGRTGGTGSLRPAPCPATYPGGAAAVAARTACAQIGKPYSWGSTGPNMFDCSGLTLYAWRAAGVTLRHYTRWQWQDARPISRSELRPGDLVFYYSDLHHVGMYVGNGWIVHAPHSGDVVRMKRVDDGPVVGYRRPG